MVNILAIIKNNYDELYSKQMMPIIKSVVGDNMNSLFVSLNKTYRTMTLEFAENKIDLNNFFFIDTITSTVIEPTHTDKCIFLPSAEDTTLLYDTIMRVIKEKNIYAIIFDSLSSLTTYHNQDEVINFINKLLGGLAAYNCSSILVCLRIDEDTKLIRHVKMKIDKVYESN